MIIIVIDIDKSFNKIQSSFMIKNILIIKIVEQEFSTILIPVLSYLWTRVTLWKSASPTEKFQHIVGGKKLRIGH